MEDLPDEAPEPVVESVPEVDPRIAVISATVDQWMVDCIHSSPVSRDTASINHLIAALPELKRRIIKEIA